MSIITLTTDLGYRDPYLAIVKAKILSTDSSVQIIDLSCTIKDNNISDASYILRNSLPYFPVNSIHLVAVKFIIERSDNNKSGNIDHSRYLLTRYADQYIISPDNGLFTLIDKDFDAPVYQLYYEGENKHHFFLKDVLVNTALHLIKGKQVEEIASLTSDYYKAFQFESYVSGNILRGKGIYVDDFGNIVTNITKEKFIEVVGNRPFIVSLPGSRINKINTTYDDVKYGNTLILFNSFGYLEVAANGKSAFNMLCPRDIGSKFDFNLLIEIL
jgi:S-adenosyl-L-methionine hydrolase (adenosine-forming)